KDDIRSLFINFFLERGHVLLPNVSLIPDDDTVLLTSAGVMQVQPFFLGLAEPPARRLVNVQRVLRTVDIEEVGDDSHLTFFEMLGNWSIGDYFKEQAIAWSWELITDVLRFPRERIWVTVHDSDEESPAIWRRMGVPPERIVALGDEGNWWAPGDTGPCGPDTEIFYDRGEAYGCGRADCKPGCDCDRFLEFWNNVFTQYNRLPDGSLQPLAAKNVDTGAGLERWAMLLQDKPSVYETDCFWPLIEAVANVAGVSYSDETLNRALRIVADHGRALTFLIADGVAPSPDGRGYILRRLLRRAVMNGRQLGLRRPFLADVVVPAVVDMMKEGYPALAERREYIAQVADAEERQFLETLERGIVLIEALLDRSTPGGLIDGAAVFDLRQTHGVPLELTQDLARDRGLTIDMDAYRAAEERHSRVSGAGQDFFAAARNNTAYGEIAESLGHAPDFLGYDTLDAIARVVGIVKDSAAVREAAPGDTVQVVLDRTPFYAASGGQVGDKGTLLEGTGAHGGMMLRVVDTERPKGSAIVVHTGTVEGQPLRVGDEVSARVDPHLRAGAARHHSATHLAHRALKDVLGESVHQEGSVVEPTRFTFDFNLPRPMTPDELRLVEHKVNELIRADLPVETAVLPYAEAMKTGAMALFTEKYGDEVRVVTMGPSRELCGGTHVRRTGELGAFFILSESSASAGVRRIECVAGEAAYLHARGQMDRLNGLAVALDAQPAQLGARIQALRDNARTLERQLNAARQEIAALKVQGLTAGGPGDGAAGGKPEQKDGFQYVVQRVDAGSADDLKSISDALKGRLAPCVIVLGAAVGGRAVFTA
ncbi:MAG: alanine--tRNA ligase, partial [Chloroflexota bacterium]|nr:alanine--tRNA ligase [Chloroflexota bacterium]